MLIGHYLRRWFLPFFFKRCGRKLQVRPRVHFESIENISVGDRVSFNYNSFVNAYGGLTIGDDCLFGPFLTIVTSNHKYNSSDIIRELGHVRKPVIIGDNVWIGANATILPGVTIGNHVIIGAGSVVVRNIPDKSLVVGNPSRIIKSLA